MHVALVCPYDLAVPGGVQMHVQHLGAALRAQGARVTVIAPGRDGDHEAVGGSARVRFNGAVAPVALGPAAAVRTRRALARARPDVVHVHEPMVPWVGLAAATSRAAPVVATFHAWSDRDGAYRLTRPLAGRLRGRLAARLAVSEAAAAYHARALQWAPHSFRVVPNGVEVARFRDAAPFPEVADDPAPSLLFVGRVERRKGLEPLVRAFTLLKADRPDLRLHVVGEGPELARCRRLLPERLRADAVFHGRVPRDDVSRWFASCDLYVSPALGGESFGIVLLEAMAAGRAFVASDLPGYRSVASDGVQGRLVPPGDHRALADAIGPLLDNPSLRAAMGREGKRTAADYDWAKVAATLRDVYGAALRAGA